MDANLENCIGRLRVEFHPNSSRLINSSQTVSWQQKVLFGGHYEPLDCYSRHRVAIIIPYRDRKEHLFVLLNQLHPILQRQQLDYKIFVVEQCWTFMLTSFYPYYKIMRILKLHFFGNDTFNKGVLMNAGVKEALKEYDFHCFVFHDVDLIPEDDRNLYTCPAVPRHMSVAVDKFNYS
ncbi:uncharacterized protein B4U80_05148 [Leptotrombidium deliense]|uniref:Galactosyltransferase N-terminal domain-containing protein n=1 Tax=Leptotrombidium deliense TaxID=299467 RepID=A0A443SP52_9ACAR|nr:uncharacterized protein B4U80_05148 [Leptotrombidium deliense]